MHKGFLISAAMMGALAVVLGAFGAHGLKTVASAQQLLSYDTAVKYQFYHVFALALTGVLYQSFPSKWLLIAGRLFIAGIFVFSGSLYLLTLLAINGYHQFNWLGAITPIGGILLVFAWIMMGYTLIRFKL